MKKKNKGQLLIELLIAIALAAVLLPSLLTGFAASREGKAQTGERMQAVALMTEMEEAMRSIREKGWSGIATNNTYHPEVSGSSWVLVAGPETINTNFVRQLTISNVYRDANGAIAGGGTLDPSTKKIDYMVSWSNPSASSITTTEYLERYIGNTTTTQTTQADFDAGTKTNTQSTGTGGGTIQLSPATSGGTYTIDYTNSGDYTFDSNKIEVTSGYAQLKNQGSPVSGQTTNPGFNTNPSGWTFARYQTNVSQAGSYQGTGGIPGGYIRINFPADKNKIAGGYYYQAFTTTSVNPTATLSFNWQVSAYQATPDSFHLYAWIDSGSGTPTTVVWDSGNIAATSGWSGTVSINAGSFLTTAGTYYLKVGAYLDYNNGQTRGPYTLGFDNVLLSWSGTSASYPTDSPIIYSTTSFQPAILTGWTSFSTTEIPNGGSIRYQLSDDDGSTWKYWNGSTWALAGATNYNDAATINTNIPTFPITNGKIRVKAFLVSNGTQFVRLDQVSIGYTGSVGPNSGSFISSSINIGNIVSLNRFAWTETNTPNTTIKFQIASNTDNATWNFVGPDGNAGTYFTGGSGAVPLSITLTQYFKYKIDFTSTNADIPSVSDVTVNYSP